jgi:hypothetical protein
VEPRCAGGGQSAAARAAGDELTKLTTRRPASGSPRSSPVELTRAYLARIEQVQPRVNA